MDAYMNPNSRLVSPKTSIEARVLGASTISRTRSERSIDEMPRSEHTCSMLAMTWRICS